MRIGIDVSSLVYGTGVSDYTEGLVSSLITEFPSQDYVLYGASLRQYFRLFKRTQRAVSGNKAEFKLYPFPPKLQKRLFNSLHLPVERFTGRLDIFHSWDWYTPATKNAKLVTTIHDLSALKFPKSTHPEIVRNHKAALEWVKQEAKAVIAVSEATKRDVVELLSIPERRVHVVHEALPVRSKIKVAKSKKDKVLEKYKINKPYFMAVASQEPRKNLKRTIEAYMKYKKDFQMVLVGKSGFERLDDNEGVVKTGYVTDGELAALYSGSSCLLYPSLYEGFGLPILEAFYHRIPVVTSNISSMPEVAGKAAVLVDPKSVISIERGIGLALKDKKQLVMAGTNRLKEFSWEKVARETMKVYKSVLSE